MLSYANAKINLGLFITGKRADGYHNLETVFYPFPLYDIVEISPSSGSGATLTITGMALEANEDNLCLKAYRLLAQDFSLAPCHIHLHKQIPFGAGLGGGSSDGATVLNMLNSINTLGLTEDQLAAYALQLGADCPFFIRNKPVFAHGIGADFEDLDLDLSDYYLVLIKPDIHISTAEAYQLVKPNLPDIDLQRAIQLPVQEWKFSVGNDFEYGIFERYPEIRALKHALYDQGAIYASMSGSGSTVYAIFDEAVDLSALAQYGTIYTPA